MIRCVFRRFACALLVAASTALAQPTSLAFPPALDFPALEVEAAQQLAKYPHLQKRFEALRLTHAWDGKQNLDEMRASLGEIRSLRALIADGDAHLHAELAVMAMTAHMWLNDIAASDRELADWHRLCEVRGWTQANFRWKLEVRHFTPPLLRSVPNIEKLLLARVNGWKGLGVTPGESSTANGMLELEYVVTILGWSASRMFLFEDLRPRLLQSFPRGHPMRAFCEAKWSFVLRTLGRLRESQTIVDAALAELVPGRPDQNRRLEISLAREAAVVYSSLGEFVRAKELSDGVQEEVEAMYPPGHYTIGYAWGTRAGILTGLGDYDGAIAAWKKSAETDRMNAHMRLGILLMQLGRAEEGVALIGPTMDPEHIWKPWGWVGASAMAEHFLAAGQPDTAARWLRGAMQASSDLSPASVPETSYFLLLQSQLAAARGNASERKRILSDALAMASGSRSELNLIRVLFEWGDLLASESNADASIAAGKAAARRLQSYRLAVARGAKVELNPLPQNFHAPLERLMERLIDAGRLPEVEQVLAVLAEERYFDFVRSPKRYSGQGNIALNRLEERMASDLVTLEKSAVKVNAAIEAEWLDMEPQRDSALAAAAALRDARSRLRDDAVQTMQRIADAFGEPKGEGRRAVASLPTHEQGTPRVCMNKASATVTFVSASNGYTALVETCGGIQAIPVTTGRTRANHAVQKMRQVLARADVDPRPIAISIYQMLFKEVDAVLVQKRVARVTLIAEGALRYLPFAAMHDGKNYLVTRYVFSSGSAVTANPAHRNVKTGAPPSSAIFSVSHFDAPALVQAKLDTSPLPSAMREMADSAAALGASRVDGVLSKSAKTYPEFSRAQLLAVMRANRKPAIVHFVSHFMAEPGAEGESKLLTADGFVSLREMSAWDWHGIDMVTFSACNTGLAASGTSSAIKEGALGGPHEVVLRGGANHVIASLWMVNDASTATFMPLLYRGAGEGADWASRLAATQRHFASGRAGAAFAHPYHWAAFMLHANKRPA